MIYEYELDWLKRWNLYSPNKVAIKDGDSGRTVTYSQLYNLATQTALNLKKEFNITRGDRVVLLAQNEIESIILFFAVQRLGACLVPANFRLTAREVSHIVKDSQPKLIVTQNSFFSLVPPDSAPVVVMSESAPLFYENNGKETSFQASETDTAMILYTSGTTGAPKGACLTHRMLFWNSINTTLRLNITEEDSAVIFLPLFHTGGWNVLLSPFLHRGASAILIKKFEADRVLDLSSSEKCTLLFGVPTTMSMMAHHPSFTHMDLKKIRYAIVGGEPMPLEAIHVWNKKGIPIRQGYGLTEFGPNVFSLGEQDAEKKIGSIGFPNFYVETRVVKENGMACKASEIGELCLKGPMMMSGYWRNEKATQDTIIDGWLHTGDLVKFDDDGFYYVVGRKKDMFISGGENVYPAEIEQVLSQIPQVREVAVVGVPDPKWGEVGKAFLVTSEPLSPEFMTEHCLRNLAKFKVPKHFEFRESLPKGDSGKILKRLLTSP
jgi:fatty-acyl-CoA synthase